MCRRTQTELNGEIMTLDTSKQNADFWNELCGSQLASELAVTDSSVDSLKRFDDWYFEFYPYLFDHIPFEQLRDKYVLEVGLGYGTVAQRLASGCRYAGLDIAQGPVQMVNHRLAQVGLQGKAIQGSILEPPFEKGTFDAIVAIGCLHHTGDLQLAINRCYELLRPGGKLIFMVYYAYSYRRWYNCMGQTLHYLGRELFGYRGVVGGSSGSDRASYDKNAKGLGAPHTDWISIRSLRYLCREYSRYSPVLENIVQEVPFSRIPREKLMESKLPRIMGLDLYVTATK